MPNTRLAHRLLPLALLVLPGLGCGDEADPPPSGGRTAAEGATEPVFEDRTTAAGLDFVHANGMTGAFYIAEVTAGGVGMVDYDGDGDLDLYLLQGGALGPEVGPDALAGDASTAGMMDRLYRNDLTTGPDGQAVLRFTDVTAQSGIRSFGYGMGIAAGDADGDGDVDLYVTNLGPNQLWRNEGDGTFVDATTPVLAGTGEWSLPATFFDFDGDGDLDLFVGNYLDFSWDNHRTCLSVTGTVDYCGPSAYRPLTDRLLENLGDGTFRDVSAEKGLLAAYGPAMGVVATDLDGDGRIDLYVTNDGQPNQMWLQLPNGAFEDRSLSAGTAVSGEGVPEASMGAVAADFTGDGLDDLFMTHITGETHTFYQNLGGGLFRDTSIRVGLAAPSKAATGFGVAAVDYDNDGRLDLFVANGAVRTLEEQARQQSPYPFAQVNQLFHNVGEEGFEDVSEALGPAAGFAVSRGVAAGDLDNDGDADLLVLNSNAAPQLLINRVGQAARWLGLRLLTADGRDALGARVALYRAEGPPLWRRVATDGSFASANDPRVLFGLGSQDAAKATGIEVRWPSGKIERFPPAPLNRYTTLREGEGNPA